METESKTFPSQWYGITFTEEERAIMQDPKKGIRAVTTLILENGLKARQAKTAGDMTEMHQTWMIRCAQLLIAAREHPTLVGGYCDPACLAQHLGVPLEVELQAV